MDGIQLSIILGRNKSPNAIITSFLIMIMLPPLIVRVVIQDFQNTHHLYPAVLLTAASANALPTVVDTRGIRSGSPARSVPAFPGHRFPIHWNWWQAHSPWAVAAPYDRRSSLRCGCEMCMAELVVRLFFQRCPWFLWSSRFPREMRALLPPA